VEGTAADKAAVKAGDVLTSIAGTAVKTVVEAVTAIGRHRPGKTIELVVQRGGDELRISVTLGARPTNDPRFRAPEDRWGGGPFSNRRYGFPLALAHDAPILPTDCGGPLVDVDGTVAGINIARALRVTTYAIPADAVKSVVADLKKILPPPPDNRKQRAAVRRAFF
jgi:serine protease Do